MTVSLILKIPDQGPLNFETLMHDINEFTRKIHIEYDEK